MDKGIKIIEKICISGIIILSIIIVAGGIILFLRSGDKENEEPEEPEQVEQIDEFDYYEEEDISLAELIDYLPDSIYYGEKLPVTEFQAKDGNSVSLSRYEGRKLILMFWGSWCPYCNKVLQNSAEFEALLRKYEDYEFVLINKLDPEKKETVEKVENYLAKNEVPFENLYDTGLIAYDAYGLSLIPTLLVLDERGYLRYMTVAALGSPLEFKDILDYVESGGAAATGDFIKSNMMGEDGGIYTNYMNKGGDPPVGHDVLSESQGIIMEYAVLNDDPQLFGWSWQYTREKLYRDGIFSWYATTDGQQGNANALLDDLRIYKALKKANSLWGGYDDEVKELAAAIGSHNVTDGHLAGFYDFTMKMAGSTIPLFYIDLEALRELEREDTEFTGLSEEAAVILQEGYIGDEFPLYYSSYDYRTGEYSKDSMNTAEALMSLYHATKAGIANQASFDWLEEKVVSGTLAARYETDGQVVDGFAYDSTAVYAIAVLIGYEAGNSRIYTYARNRMEKYYVSEQTSFKGSFGDTKDGSDIIAFDQLMPLIAYSSTKETVFDD